MKGFRKLRVGEVIREGDVFCNAGEKPIKYIYKRIGTRVCPVGIGAVNTLQDASPSYRPLPSKKVEKWKVWQSTDGKIIVGDKDLGERARVWSLRDARLIVRCVNKCLEGK
jgi:hypothetical protein